MSEFTMCNYCSLMATIRRAALLGKEVTVLHGHTVYVHPPDVDVTKLDGPEREKFFCSWYMELTNHCVC